MTTHTYRGLPAAIAADKARADEIRCLNGAMESLEKALSQPEPGPIDQSIGYSHKAIRQAIMTLAKRRSDVYLHRE